MKEGKPRKLDEFLASGALSGIAAEARARRQLVSRVRAELPAEQAEHVVSASTDDADRLVVGVDSSAWAAKLRFEYSELLGRPIRVRVTAPGGSGNGDD